MPRRERREAEVAVPVSCDCVTEFNERLAEHNTRITIPMVFGDVTPRPMIVTEQIATGRGKKKAVGLFVTYCPFCGQKYKDGETKW